MPLISIIILTKNAGENFESLLQRIFNQEINEKFEVVIIDSGSTDDTLEIAKKFPVRLYEIRPDEFHHGRTRNFGAQLSEGEFLIYISQDALPLRNDWLKTLIDNFEDREVAAVYGRQIPWEVTKPPEKFFYHYHFPARRIVVKYDGNKYLPSHLRDNVFISNVNAAIRKHVWIKFRFSESILMAEDKDFAKNILFVGYKIVYDPDAAVFHSHNFGILSVFKKYFDFGIALAQGVQGLPKSEEPLPTKVFKYFLSEIKYLYHNNHMTWVPYALIYDLSKLLGLFLGKHKRYLPRLLKTTFSETYSYIPIRQNSKNCWYDNKHTP